MSVASRTEQLQVGEWLVDPTLDRLSRGGEIVKLEPRTMRLLMRLCESPGQVMSPQQLLDDVWSGVVVGPASVYQAISQLRKLLLDTEPVPTYIATVPRKGYRLIAPVRRVAVAADSQCAPHDPPIDGEDATQGQSSVGQRESGQEQTRRARHSGWARHALWAMGLVVVIAGASIVLLRDDSLTQGGVAMSWLNWFKEDGFNADEPASIVVLPFIDMTEDHRDEAFCDGLTEELSTTLSQLPALRVVARTSAFAFRDRNVDVREIGRKLAATHVLEGSVRRSGDAIRVTAQLIDARRGYHSWSESYDMRSKDVLRLQSDIARSVAAALELRFPEAASNVVVRADDPEAYELYLLGRHYYRQRTPEANARAAELDSKAIALDRNFAPAYVGLAQARLNEFALTGRPMHELAEEIEPLLNTALQLNPNLSEAYATRGAMHRELNRLGEAKSDLARAIALNHNNVQALVNLGRVFESEGQPRPALENFTQARMLDPLDFMRHVDRCVALEDLGRYAEAAVDCEEARALQPQSKWGYATASWLARAQGQNAQALHWNDEALRVAPADIDLYLQRVDEFLDLGMLEAAKVALQHTAAEGQNDDDPRLRIRYADVLMIERGPAAVRDYLAQLDLDETASASDLLTAAQVSVTAGDYKRAQQLAARAVSAADYPAIELAHRTAITWGTSHELLLALLQQHSGNREAATARMKELLKLADELERNGSVSWGIHSVRADALGLLGDTEGAMHALQSAVNAGWRSAWAAQRDPYLATLFERSDFRALMQRVEQLNAVERSRYQLPGA